MLSHNYYPKSQTYRKGQNYDIKSQNYDIKI